MIHVILRLVQLSFASSFAEFVGGFAVPKPPLQSIGCSPSHWPLPSLPVPRSSGCSSGNTLAVCCAYLAVPSGAKIGYDSESRKDPAPQICAHTLVPLQT